LPLSVADSVAPPTIRQVDVCVGHEELANLSQAVLARWITEGPQATALAGDIKAYTGSRHLAFAPNGTLGLFLGLLAFDLPRGSEILIPSFTFYGSAAAAVFAGLTPVFVDCYRDTFNIDIEDLERKITSKASAIMPVHMYGQACDIEGVMQLARQHDLRVIEDAAQAFGVHFDGRHAGTFGDIGVFSFFSDKSMAMGEGGALFVQDDRLFERIRYLRNQGRLTSGVFEHPELGMNFRITDLQAAVGRAQFSRFGKTMEHRQSLWKLYQEQLRGIGDIGTMSVHPKSNIIPFRFPITSSRRLELQDHLQKNGIETRPFFHPMHLQPRLRAFAGSSLPVSEQLSREGICLPVHFSISEDVAGVICQTIRAFFA